MLKSTQNLVYKLEQKFGLQIREGFSSSLRTNQVLNVETR